MTRVQCFDVRVRRSSPTVRVRFTSVVSVKWRFEKFTIGYGERTAKGGPERDRQPQITFRNGNDKR